jgi:hypothetical protein
VDWGQQVSMSGGRQTALALLLAIIAARVLLNGRLQTAWWYLWHSTAPLGQESILLQIYSANGATQAATQAGNAASPAGSGIQKL